MVDDGPLFLAAASLHLLPHPLSAAVAHGSIAAPPDFPDGLRLALHWDFDGADAIRNSHFLDRIRAHAARDHAGHALLLCRDRVEGVGDRPEHPLAELRLL